MTHLGCSLSQQAPQDECMFFSRGYPLLATWGSLQKRNDWLQSGDLRIYCRWVTKFFHRWIIRCTRCIFFAEIYMSPTCINTGYTYIYMHKNTCMPSCASNLYFEICQQLVVFMRVITSGKFLSGSGGCDAFTLFRCQHVWCFFVWRIKGQLGVPPTVHPWYLLCSQGILGDYNP